MTNTADHNQNYLTAQIGEGGEYSVNTYTGRQDFIKRIADLGGSLLPASMYFVYNPFCEEGIAIGLPAGWKFNFHQKIVKNGNAYTYADAKGHSHTFKRLTDSLYYDSAHTGLLLKAENGIVKITDDRNNTLYFDESGYLKKIEECKGAVAASIELTYLGGKITAIEDGMGRRITVNYGNNFAAVSLPDGSCVKIESKNGNTLITDKDGGIHTYTFINKGGKALLETATASGGEGVKFTYDSGCKATSVTEVINGVNYKKRQLSYNSYYTVIAHINNIGLNTEVSYRTADIFALNGEYISSFEVDSDEEMIMRLFKSKDAYGEYMLNLAATKYSQGKIGGNTAYTFSNAGGVKAVEGSFSSGLSVDAGEQCAISMQLLNYELADMGKKITVRVEKKSAPGMSLLAQPFTITLGGPFVVSEAAALTATGSLSGIKFVLETEESISRVAISNIRLGVMKKNGHVACTDGGAGTTVYTERLGGTTKSWRKIYDCTLNGVSGCERMTQRDWLLSKDNEARAAGGSFVIWYNDLGGAVLADGGQKVSVNGQLREFSAINYARVSFDRALTSFEYTEYDSDGYFAKTVNNQVRGTVNRLCASYTDVHGRVVKTVDSNGVSYAYEYDGYGRAIKETMAWTGGTAEKSVEYSAAKDGKYTVSVTKYGKNTLYTYDYDSGELISVRDGNGNTTEYTFDALGRMKTKKGTAGFYENKNEVGYAGSKISSMEHAGASYDIEYDNKKHISAFKIGGENFFTTENFLYGMHGEFVTYNLPAQNVTQYYDRYGRAVKEVWSSGGQRCYCYGAESESMSGVTASNFERRTTYSTAKLRKVIDGSYNVVYNYSDGEISGIEYSNGNEYAAERDLYGRIETERVKAGGRTYTTTYIYGSGDAYNGDRLTTYFVSAGGKLCIGGLTYDDLGRVISQSKGVLTGSSADPVINEQYSYGNADITQVSKITYGDGSVSNYSYDSCGNITRITGKEDVKYTYDALNRLVREDNAALNGSYTYSYDAGGNITAKKVYAYTTGTLKAPIQTINYVYGDAGWKDKLTSWNGKSITYDESGNPLSYKGGALTWDERNRLKSSRNSTAYIEYTYAQDGKPVNAVALISFGYVGTKELTYAEGRLYRQTVKLTNVSGDVISETQTEYLYRGEEVIGLIYNGELYYYRKNLQGDIIAIVDEAGNEAGRYTYDAWGNCSVSGSGVMSANPFRYRGYYWDGEAGLYYLNTRWYDPEVGRFISPDSINYLDPESLNGLNLYAYCLNNPVMYSDPYGTSWWTDFWNSIVGKIVGTILVVGAVVVVSVLTAGVGAAVTGALGGGIAATIVGGAVSGAVSGMLIGAGASIVSQGVNDGYGNIDWGQVGIAVISGAVLGAVTGALTSGVRILNAASKWYKGTFKSGLQSMRYHYSKHGSGFGNILNYTKSAINFAIRNSSLLKYTFNYKFGNASWNFSYLYGNGGMFTSSGKIITFW